MSAPRTAAARRPPAAARRRLAAVVLAAGRGKRLRSSTPKVLHEVCGRPALWFVLQAALAVRPGRIVVVVHEGAERVREAVDGFGLRPEVVFVDQGAPLGTGHAVMAAEGATRGFDEVLVLAGADPLVTGEQLRRLLGTHRRRRAAATLLSTTVPDPTGYGRIVRENGRLVEIAEETDASPEIRAIDEVAALVYAFRREDLFAALPSITRETRQREYYLHHVFPIMRDAGGTVAVVAADLGGVLGIDRRADIARVGRVLRARIVEGHMANGVTFVDPDTAYVDATVRIGRDTVIEPMAILQGDTRIGSGCRIGPSVRVADSTVADHAEVSFAVVLGSRVGPGATVGPFARMRPGTVLAAGARVGTFVDVKNARIGEGSKVPHLSYVGDATIGRGVNIGAGSITCNYDGYEKHRTSIGDEVFVGSDTMMVAPVRIGARAWTGAGSTIARDVPAGALAVERSEQRNVRGYDDRKRRAHGGRAPGGSGKAKRSRGKGEGQ